MAGGEWTDLSRPPLRDVVVGGGWRVEVVEATGSTNADVAARARAGEPAGLVLVAEEQVQGRGRLGRTWTSPPRAGLTFSALLTVPPSPWVPLLAGVAVCRALSSAAGLDARLKWPNDVLVRDRKICGILAEVAAGHVVLGIGLNVSTRADELPPDRPSTSVLLAGGTADRLTLLRAILRALADDASRADYRDLCATLGREVTVHLPDGTVSTGTATAVDDDGRLVVADAAGAATAYAAGDVVHLR
ncbi:MAG TPA: biotin--[acetyl-CoA-carboxylase] ligase [Mycobacteriales bacterium]